MKFGSGFISKLLRLTVVGLLAFLTMSTLAWAATIPDAPKSLDIEEASAGRVTVTWDKVTGATKYIVYVECKKENKQWEFERNLCELKLKNLKAGYTYTFYVKAANTAGKSEASETKEIKISEADLPDAPNGLKIEETSAGKITITWNKVSGAKKYKVYVECKEDNKKWEFERSACELKLKDLKAGNTYEIYVTTLNDEEESGPSEIKKIKISEPDVPDAPVGLEIEETSAGRITITWDKVSGAKSYKVYVECDKDDKKWEFERSACELKLKGLKAGRTYEVYVTALNDEGESESSKTEKITINEGNVPEPPEDIQVKEESDGRVIVNWDKVSEATGYIVYVECEEDNKDWKFERSRWSYELKLKNLKTGYKYKIYVTTVNDEGESEPSETETITISKSKVPKAPKDLKATETYNDGIKVSWSASSGATGYNVYYKWDNESSFHTYDAKKKTYCTLKNLAKKDKYEIYVKAYNSVGTSEASESIRKDNDDDEKPTKPQTLMASLKKVGSSLNVHLIWEPSEDNVRVEGYTIYRFNPDKSSDAEKKWSVDADDYDDGDEITTVDKNVKKGELYIYVVEAYDKEGNKSDFSNGVEVSTKDY